MMAGYETSHGLDKQREYHAKKNGLYFRRFWAIKEPRRSENSSDRRKLLPLYIVARVRVTLFASLTMKHVRRFVWHSVYILETARKPMTARGTGGGGRELARVTPTSHSLEKKWPKKRRVLRPQGSTFRSKCFLNDGALPLTQNRPIFGNFVFHDSRCIPRPYSIHGIFHPVLHSSVIYSPKKSVFVRGEVFLSSQTEEHLAEKNNGLFTSSIVVSRVKRDPYRSFGLGSSFFPPPLRRVLPYW